MKTGKIKLRLLLPVLLLCLFCMGQTARAASYRQIAYVNSTDKALIFKFKDFCTEGYKWKITRDSATPAAISGSESGGKIGTSRMLKIRLGDKYMTKTKYTLTVTGKDKKKSLTVHYFTGGALDRANVSRTSKDAMKSEVVLSNGFKGNSVEFLVFKGADSTDLITGAKLAKTKVSGNKITMKAEIPSSRIKNDEYKTYVVLNYVYDGKPYFGQGKALPYKYIKTQHKVKGVKISTLGGRVNLTWAADKNASYYKVYQGLSKNGSYRCVKSKVTAAAYRTGSLKGGKTYYYKIIAVGAAGSKTSEGEQSEIRSIKVPIVPGKVPNIRFGYNMSEELIVKWNKTLNSTGYIVLYQKAGEKKFKKLGSTKNRFYSLSSLKRNTTYKIKIQAYRKANGETVKAEYTSKVLKIKPAEFEKKNRALLLANGVRPIEHINGRSIYTRKKYSKETKLAFANAKGYSSKTNYLVWISHYTQQVVIYKGRKGHWKIIKNFPTATGKASTPSPKGVFKISYKETGWYYTNTKELYITHWCGRNSFHTRPLYNDGSVCSPTIGRPVSHGCARLYNNDAYYIYRYIPKGTTVISY